MKKTTKRCIRSVRRVSHIFSLSLRQALSPSSDIGYRGLPLILIEAFVFNNTTQAQVEDRIFQENSCQENARNICINAFYETNCRVHVANGSAESLRTCHLMCPSVLRFINFASTSSWISTTSINAVEDSRPDVLVGACMY